MDEGLSSFGRAAWVFDDIEVFRELARSNGRLLSKDFKVLSSTVGYQANIRSVDGVRFTADANFIGDNKSANPLITMWVKEKEGKAKIEMPATTKSKKKKREKEEVKMEEPKKDKKSKGKKVLINVVDLNGDTLRTFSRELKPGMNRINWGMNRNGVRFPSWSEPKKDSDPPGRGAPVIPGTYKMFCEYQDHTDSVMVEVKLDPRLNITAEQVAKKEVMVKDFYSTISLAKEAFDRLKEADKTINLVNKQMEFAHDTVQRMPRESKDLMTESILTSIEPSAICIMHKASKVKWQILQRFKLKRSWIRH